MNSPNSAIWKSTTGLKQAKGLISGPSAKRTKDLLKLNRDQFRWVVELLTAHLFKMGLTDDRTCERCLEDESATHILCDCEDIANLDFVTWASSLWNQVTIMTPP
jgi:hypothetical protein